MCDMIKVFTDHRVVTTKVFNVIKVVNGIKELRKGKEEEQLSAYNQTLTNLMILSVEDNCVAP